MAERAQFQWIAMIEEALKRYKKFTDETRKILKTHTYVTGYIKKFVKLVEDTPELPGEEKEAPTTVIDRLLWQNKANVDKANAELTRDVGNVFAKADLVIDDITFAKDLPVPFLLSFEKLLIEQREIVELAPTLDMSKKWEKMGNNRWKHGPTFTNREEKTTRGVTLYPATKEFPAQIDKVTDMKVVAKWETTTVSGALHPGMKAALLERFDMMIEAVKTARLKANETKVKEQLIGRKVFDWIYEAESKE